MLKINTSQLVTGVTAALLAWWLINRVLPSFTAEPESGTVPLSDNSEDGSS